MIEIHGGKDLLIFGFANQNCMKTSHLNFLIALLALVALLIAHAGSAQSDPTSDCHALSIQAADEIADGMAEMNMRKVRDAIRKTSASCGMSEVSLRMSILASIVKHEPIDEDLKVYFDNGFHNRTIQRINMSSEPDYGYIYHSNQSRYGYVPLRHRIDSISGKVAEALLASRDLSEDEKAVCALFAGDVMTFYEQNSSASKQSYVGSHWRDVERMEARRRPGLVISTGQYVPFGNRNVLSSSPTFGFGLSSPVDYKLIIELGIKFRFHHGDSTFVYDAMGKLNDVDPDEGIFGGLIVGYKLYDKKNWIMQSRLGLGIESIDTGLEEQVSKSQPTNAFSPTSSNDSDTKYYDLETLHSSLGLSIMKGIGKKKYVGATVDIHLTPYGFDKRLKTKLDNTAVSAELFLRL